MLIYRIERVNPISESLLCTYAVQAVCEVLPVPLDLKGEQLQEFLSLHDCWLGIWTERKTARGNWFGQEELLYIILINLQMKCSLLEIKKDTVWWLTQYGYCYGIQPHFLRIRTDCPALPIYGELLKFSLLQMKCIKNKRHRRRVRLSVSQYVEKTHDSSKDGRVTPFFNFVEFLVCLWMRFWSGKLFTFSMEHGIWLEHKYLLKQQQKWFVLWGTIQRFCPLPLLS